MANRRSYTDDQLRQAVGSAETWSDVLVALGKRTTRNRDDVRRVAARIGLDTSHLNGHRRSRVQVAAAGMGLFTRLPAPGHRSSVAVAAKWFMDRGYVASVPLDVAPYDLVVESDSGLKKVQIKTTSYTDKYGRYAAQLTKHEYDGALPSSAGGRRRRRPYQPEDVDLFFIITATGDAYLIPIDVVGGRLSVSLDNKYANFKVV